ncbi:hypothetical protein IEQ34_026463 [Dendrobium chrysotoxum]|uniref:GPI-anchored protein LLG1-like domain-containing protein n=1 Tax=Dendrobium chrysotoxum TaxID=161865 RepID=A0AAV7FMT4_DENCH|nr:hypothetical protein IEQ34_026463 [Dendrobium chrysotoxum]
MKCGASGGGPAKCGASGGGPAKCRASGGGPVKCRASGGGPAKCRASGGGPAKSRASGGSLAKCGASGGGPAKCRVSGGGPAKSRASGGGLTKCKALGGDQLNDLTNDCATTMFSYINLYGKYPPGLFAYECREGKEGLDCSAYLNGTDHATITSSANMIRSLSPVIGTVLGVTVALLVIETEGNFTFLGDSHHNNSFIKGDTVSLLYFRCVFFLTLYESNCWPVFKLIPLSKPFL